MAEENKEKNCEDCRHSSWTHSPGDLDRPVLSGCRKGLFDQEECTEGEMELIPKELARFIKAHNDRKYGVRK